MVGGQLLGAAVGGFFFALAVAQWYGPRLHYLQYLTTRDDSIGETGEQHMSTLVRAMTVAGMYVAGAFLALSWTFPVLERLYTVGTALLP